MPIEKTAHFVNTDRRRLKKMTPKLWKELLSLEELRTLYFERIEDVDDYLARIAEISRLEEIGFISIHIGEKISDLSIPRSCKTLYIKNVESDHLSRLPTLEYIYSAKFNQDDKQVALILQRLPNLQNLEIGNTYDEEGLSGLLEAIRGLEALQVLTIARNSLREETVKSYFALAKEKSIEINWETDEDSQILVDKFK
jgi:hypothetical protein